MGSNLNENEQMVPWKGAICDPVGFMQHSGECWMDVITELFMFSDSIKHITQKMLYTMSDEQLRQYANIILTNYKKILKNSLNVQRKSLILPVVLNMQINAISQLAYRFKNHYNKLYILNKQCHKLSNTTLRDCYLRFANTPNSINILNNIPTANTPSSDPSIEKLVNTTNYINTSKQFNYLKRYRRNSFNLSRNIVRGFKGAVNPLCTNKRKQKGVLIYSREEVVGGGEPDVILLSFILLFELFQINFKMCTIYPKEIVKHLDDSDILTTIPGVTLPDILSKFLKPTNIDYILKNPSIFYIYCLVRYDLILDTNETTYNILYNTSHATGILQCNNNLYYYDDNKGIFPISSTIYEKLLNYIEFSKSLLLDKRYAFIESYQRILQNEEALIANDIDSEENLGIAILLDNNTKMITLAANNVLSYISDSEPGITIQIKYIYDLIEKKWVKVNDYNNRESNFTCYVIRGLNLFGYDTPPVALPYIPKKTLWNRIRGRGRGYKRGRRTKKHKCI